MYKTIFIILILLFLVYLLFLEKTKITEGLTVTKEDLNDTINLQEKEIEKSKDTLLIYKNADKYQKILANIEEQITLFAISTLSSTKIDTQEKAEKIKNFITLRKILPDLSNYIDNETTTKNKMSSTISNLFS